MEGQINLVMVGVEIQEVVISADGNNITTPPQIIIKETNIEQMKVLNLTSGNPRKTIQASKIRRTKIWWQNNL